MLHTIARIINTFEEIGQVVGSDCFREFIIPTIQVELNGDANNDSVKRNKKTDEKNKGDWEQGSIKRKVRAYFPS